MGTDSSVAVPNSGSVSVDGQLVTTGVGSNIFRTRSMLQREVGAGDAVSLTNTDLVALAAVNGTPTVDRLRTAQAVTDAYSGLGLLAAAPNVWNGASYDRWRSLYSSGFGLGVAKVAGDTYLAATSCTAAQAAAGNTLVNAVGTRGIWKRKLRLQSTLNAVATVSVYIYNSAGLNFVSLQLSVPAGNTTTVQSEINDIAISTTFGSAVTKVAGFDLSVLATP